MITLSIGMTITLLNVPSNPKLNGKSPKIVKISGNDIHLDFSNEILTFKRSKLNFQCELMVCDIEHTEEIKKRGRPKGNGK